MTDWSNMGLAGRVWESCLDELEHLVRWVQPVSRQEPEEELPGAELSDGEQRAAVRGIVLGRG